MKNDQVGQLTISLSEALQMISNTIEIQSDQLRVAIGEAASRVQGGESVNEFVTLQIVTDEEYESLPYYPDVAADTSVGATEARMTESGLVPDTSSDVEVAEHRRAETEAAEDDESDEPDEEGEEEPAPEPEPEPGVNDEREADSAREA